MINGDKSAPPAGTWQQQPAPQPQQIAQHPAQPQVRLGPLEHAERIRSFMSSSHRRARKRTTRSSASPALRSDGRCVSLCLLRRLAWLVQGAGRRCSSCVPCERRGPMRASLCLSPARAAILSHGRPVRSACALFDGPRVEPAHCLRAATSSLSAAADRLRPAADHHHAAQGPMLLRASCLDVDPLSVSHGASSSFRSASLQ